MEQSPRSSSRKVELWLVGVFCLVAGLVTGVFAGNFFGDAPSAEPRSASATALSAGAPVAETNRIGIPERLEENANALKGDHAAGSTSTSIPGADGVAKAINEALQMEPPYDLARMLLLIKTLPKEQFPVVLDILRKRKSTLDGGDLGDQGPPFWYAFWQRFGELDPETAFAKSIQCTDLQFAKRNKLQKHLFQGMGRSDPEKAAALLLSQAEYPNKIDAVEGLMVAWGGRDIRSASTWAKQHFEKAVLDRAFYALGWTVSDARDISRGITLLKDQEPGAGRNGLFSALKDQAYRKQALPVPQILNLLAAATETGTRDPDFEDQMILRCANTDPLAAAEFLVQSTPRETGTETGTLDTVVNNWAARDLKAAEEWAKGYEGKPAYKAVALAFAFAAEQRGDSATAKLWMQRSAQ